VWKILRDGIESMNFGDDLNRCLKFLDWTKDDLAGAMGNRYGSDFLGRICAGRPFPEVEHDIVAAVTKACAERVKFAVADARFSQQAAEIACLEFVHVLKQFEMRLAGVAMFAEEIQERVTSPSEYRMLAGEVTRNDFWNAILKGIARELTQQTIFEGCEETEARENDFGTGLVESTDNAKEVFSMARAFVPRPEACFNCHRSTASYKTCKCPNCGSSWDIAN